METNELIKSLRAEFDQLAGEMPESEKDELFGRVLAEGLSRSLLQMEEMLLASEDVEKVAQIQEEEGTEAAVAWLAATAPEFPRILALNLRTHLEEMKALSKSIEEEPTTL